MEGEPYIKILRKLFSDPMWTQERFSIAQAWVDLIHFAFHSDGNFKWDGVRYSLKRGQLCISEEYLAKRWKWSRGRLRRVYKKWQQNGMITVQRLVQHSVQQTVQRKSVITLFNYDKIQFQKKETVQRSVQQTVQRSDTKRYNRRINERNNINNYKEEVEKANAHALNTKQKLDKLLKIYESRKTGLT